MKKHTDYIQSILQAVKFSFSYSHKVAGRKIWLLLFLQTYKSIHPVVNAYFIKLTIDTLTLIGQIDPSVILFRITLIIAGHFIVDAWDQYSFRHRIVIGRILQRRLVSQLEIDLASKHAALPVTTIESSDFRDKYVLVKRESAMRIFPLVDQAVSLVASTITLIVTGGVILGFSWLYLLIMVVVQIPRALTVNPAVKKITQRVALTSKVSRYMDIYMEFLESIKGSYEARILNIGSYIKNKLIQLQNKSLGFYEQVENQLLRGRIIGAILPNAGIFATSYLYLRQLIAGSGTIGNWQLLINTTYRFSDQGKGIIDNYASLRETSVFIEKLQTILNLPETADQGPKISFEQIKQIDFHNVSFKYPNANRYALKDISFTINPQENIAIVGHNGAGKTTLVKLLCRFYQPTSGQILVNGINIQNFDIHDYWHLISALFQDFETYGMSAQESIGYGQISQISNLDRIKKVAKLTGINDHLASLSQGYQTPLIRELEGGVGLSTGQWQKVAIARSLFRKSKIIILDEPTSNLDPESEEEIFNKLIRTVKKRIMILISHRFSTVKRADRIVVIESGKLVEQGSHQELMKHNGLYAKLFRIQSESYKE